MAEAKRTVSSISVRMRDLLEEGRSADVFPSASLWVADGLEPLFEVHVGQASAQSLWDLASLTKPMAVVSLAMRLQGEGRICLDERLSGCRATIRELLGHRSGLPAWWDLSVLLDSKLEEWAVGSAETRDVVRSAIEAEIEGGTHPACYSDLGYMLLGWHFEELLGEPLDSLVRGYGVEVEQQSRVMSGGWCSHRERELFGEVNDLNTHFLGGVAGHAGLFGRAEDVGNWALELLQSFHGCGDVYEPSIVRSYWSHNHFDDADTWVLGFDTPTPGKSSAGSRIGSTAVGHLGFTGTSVWIDPDPGRIAVLLTNRVAAPSDAHPAIKRFRPRIHDALFDALNGI